MKSNSRRDFILNALYTSAGILSGVSLGSFLSCGGICPRRLSAPNRTKKVLADLHAHPMLNDWIDRSPIAVELTQHFPALKKTLLGILNQTKVDWRSSHQAGVDMICVAHLNPFDEFLSMPTDPDPDAVRKTMWMIDLLEQEVEENQKYTTLARNKNELIQLLSVDKETEWEKYRIAVVHCLEGGHALGGRVDAVKEFAKRGVAMIGITHFFTKVIATSTNSLPYFPDGNSTWCPEGLSEFGKAVISEMENSGVIVDVSHCTSAAIEEVFKATKKPIVSSHSSARALGDHAYSLLDEHIQQIAGDGGIIGVILMPYWLSNYSNEPLAKKVGSLNDVVRTIRYIYKVCGHNHKHIGIGTDFAGYIPPPKDMKCHGHIELLRQKLLLEFDGDEKIVEDIMANNVIHFLKEHWNSG